MKTIIEHMQRKPNDTLSVPRTATIGPQFSGDLFSRDPPKQQPSCRFRRLLHMQCLCFHLHGPFK